MQYKYSVVSASLSIRTFAWTICLSDRKVHWGEMADWIRMPFAVLSGVGVGMDVLDFGGDR